MSLSLDFPPIAVKHLAKLSSYKTDKITLATAAIVKAQEKCDLSQGREELGVFPS